MVFYKNLAVPQSSSLLRSRWLKLHIHGALAAFKEALPLLLFNANL